MLFKITKRLFNGNYSCKVVVICPGAPIFRSGDLGAIAKSLQQIDLDPTKKLHTWRNSFIKTSDDLDYAFKLHAALSKMENYSIRVESPWISIYTNNVQDVDAIINLDSDRIKYASLPDKNSTLEEGTVIMPKTNYEFRVTLGKTTQEHTTFIEWADTNKNLKLTKGCKRDLSKSNSWGGTYFYISGDNNLLMAKMHLGSAINKVERIIKA